MTNSHNSDQKSLRLLTPPLRLSIVLAIGLTVVGLIWSCLAEISIRTRGTAVFLPANGVRRIISQTSGQLYLYDFKNDQKSWLKLAHSVLNGDNVRKQESKIIFLAQKMLVDIPKEDLLTNVQKINYFQNHASVAEGTLLARIINPSLRSALDQNLQDYLNTKNSSMEVIREYKSQINIYKNELASQEKYLAGMRELRKKQYASEAAVLQQQSTISNLQSQISTTLGQIANTRQGINSKYNALFASLIENLNKSMYFAAEDIYVDTYLRQTREFIPESTQFGIVMSVHPDKPTTIPVFFSNKNAAVVSPGQNVLLRVIAQEDQDQSTSTNGIIGMIKTMDSYPSTKDTITSLVGSEAIASLITSQYTSPTSGSIELKKDNQNKYVWSSGFNTTELKTQDEFEVEVTTKSVRPISLVLPGLLRLLGLDSLSPKPESLTLGD
jgi:hypothetical protein